jgi:hypothetical protein
MVVFMSSIPCLSSPRESSRASLFAQQEQVEERRGRSVELKEELGESDKGDEGNGEVEVTGVEKEKEEVEGG